ncbi:hypothetical protein RO787_11590 [Blautia coccoides]|uniref:OB-fold protein n=1 Tax=Blautia producta TaxID=33035 RepID=UPI0028A57897|nr:hypothetical protein [Blautia coccoides]MDT4373988.1 hypothetical protein [Blautia coccoides]
MSKEKKKGSCLKTALIVVVVLVILGAIGSTMGDSDDKAKDATDKKEATTPTKEEETPKEPEEITYTTVDVATLMDALDANAMNASDTYKDQYLEITGKLNVIDSSGKYISLTPADDEYAILGVQCYIKNEEQKSAVSGMTVGDIITLRGKCKDVGEIMGYALDIDSIN